MPRTAKNKTKAWRREHEIHMMPQEVQSTNEDGEIIKSITNVPYILRGRNLRNYRLQGQKAPALPSDTLINLMHRGGYVIIKNVDENIPNDETNVETATV